MTIEEILAGESKSVEFKVQRLENQRLFQMFICRI